MTERLSDERLAAIREYIRGHWPSTPIDRMDVERLLDEVIADRNTIAALTAERDMAQEEASDARMLYNKMINHATKYKNYTRTTIAAQNAMIAALQQGESQDPKTSWSKGMSDAADIVESKKDRDLAEIIRISRDMVVAAQPVSFKEPSQCP